MDAPRSLNSPVPLRAVLCSLDGAGRAVVDGALRGGGYDVEVLDAETGGAAAGPGAWAQAAAAARPELVVAAPGGVHDAVEGCRLVRARLGARPYVLLAVAEAALPDYLHALDAGASDLVALPVGAGTLALHLALARRHFARAAVDNHSGSAVDHAGAGTLDDALRTRDHALAALEIQSREVQSLNHVLEARVAERTAELSAANRELEAFSYSVSHDLRAPLRSIDGFSLALLEDYQHVLDATGQDFLRRIRAASQRLAALIDDLLDLARVTRAAMHRERVDLTGIAHEVGAELRRAHPERRVDLLVEVGLHAWGDPRLLQLVLQNLLGNAWKFTSRRPVARIELAQARGGAAGDSDLESAFLVRDDGAGFDPRYRDKLFRPFQRLHSAADFEGTGVGLATVARIVHRHGGRVWAESEPERGAVFYFTLPTGGASASASPTP